jgi:hypothetical protein
MTTHVAPHHRAIAMRGQGPSTTSILDADPPIQGVKVARRFTGTTPESGFM